MADVNLFSETIKVLSDIVTGNTKYVIGDGLPQFLGLVGSSSNFANVQANQLLAAFQESSLVPVEITVTATTPVPDILKLISTNSNLIQADIKALIATVVDLAKIIPGTSSDAIASSLIALGEMAGIGASLTSTRIGVLTSVIISI